MLPGVTVTCFLLSYLIALLLELSRLAVRFPGRNAILIGVLGLGWIAHTLFLVNQLSVGPAGNAASPQWLSSWFQWSILGAWGLAGAYLFLLVRNPQSALGVFLTPPILVLIVLAMMVRDAPPFSPETTVGLWRSIHGVSLLVGTMFICFGVAFGAMYLVQSRRLKSKRRPTKGFSLPTLEFLQSMNRMSLFVSAIGLGLGMISGVALNVGKDGSIAWLSGGILFTVALFIWSLIAAIMELTSQSSLGGRRTAYLAIANFVFLLVVLGIVLLSSHGQTKEVSRVNFRNAALAIGREPSNSLIPDGLRQSAKEGIYFGTFPKEADTADAVLNTSASAPLSKTEICCTPVAPAPMNDWEVAV